MNVKLEMKSHNRPGKYTGTTFDPKEKRTKEADFRFCDINALVRAVAEGNEEPLYKTVNTGAFRDVTNIPTFREAHNIIAEAYAEFEALPSGIRERFNQNPEELVAFLSDEKNRDEAIKLGLVEDKKALKVHPAGDGGNGASGDGNQG